MEKIVLNSKMLSIEEFELLCKIILDFLKQKEGPEIILDKDLYWHISERFNKSQKPQLSIGSLYEDIERLQEILETKDYPMSLDLQKLGMILIALGQAMQEENSK